ncbi:MAG: hypothetical protein K2M61_09800 [Muribaculaceae bacterium]|nr:hypothetical protein [Muribaculaceae bacterium]
MPLTVSVSELLIEEGRLRIADALGCDGAYPSEADWDFIIENRLGGLVDHLYKLYLDACMASDLDRDHFHDLIEQRFPEYLAVAPRAEALDAIYGDLYTYTDAAVHLIREAGLHSAIHLQRVLDDGDLHLCVSLLNVYQDEYEEADVTAMEHLLARFDALPRVPRIVKYRTLLGSSDRYVCPAGHPNAPGTEYCQHCGLDARGLDSDEEAIIATYTLRTRALRNLFTRLTQEE